MKRWILSGVITVAVASCVVALVVLPDSPEREIARINRQIEIELPIGTSRANVEKWLQGRKSFADVSGTVDAGISAQAYREYFWYWNGWLMITFAFDEQNCLVSHHIEFDELPL